MQVVEGLLDELGERGPELGRPLVDLGVNEPLHHATFHARQHGWSTGASPRNRQV